VPPDAGEPAVVPGPPGSAAGELTRPPPPVALGIQSYQLEQGVHPFPALAAGAQPVGGQRLGDDP
jgi:hypothetical protein